MAKTRVLIVDDSALVRQMLKEILGGAPDLEVVGTAPDPYAAREKIKKLNPDVLTLDVEMPKMDGITFLRNIMRLRPMPVVMVSSLTERGASITLEALELGAVDFVSKPKVDLAHALTDYSREIVEKVRAAARANVRASGTPASALNAAGVEPPPPSRATPGSGHFRTRVRIIAVGASTGGTEAIKEVLLGMPATSPGMVIAQHIPKAFSSSFAQRMDRIAAMTVYEARDGQPILPGHVYIAPGDRHMEVVRDGARYHCRLDDGPLVNRHKPAVDVLFRSMAENVGSNAIGVILTGMGGDGARGLKTMQAAGAVTLAQDQASSVVWGMPGEAVKLDAADQILPLRAIASHLLQLAGRD